MERLTAFFEHLKRSGVHVTAHNFIMEDERDGTLKVTLKGPVGFTKNATYQKHLDGLGVMPFQPAKGSRFTITSRKASPLGEQGNVTLHIPAIRLQDAQKIRKTF